MSVLLKLKYLLPGRRKAFEQDMREELESLASLSEADGKRSDLGSLTLVAEEGRSVWTWAWLDQLSADIRYACRTMRRNPGFTLTAVLSLALGIGANTAIFSLMNAILFKTLPVNDPATLVVLTSYSKDDKIGDFGYGDYLAIREEDAKHGDLRESTQRFVYFAALQSGSEIHSLEVRTTVSPFTVAGDIRRIVRDVDPRLRIVDTATLEQRINQKASPGESRC